MHRGRELAIDLGTANTLVFVRGGGIAVFEPSVVAIDEQTGRVQAVGEDARRMIGRTPASIRAIRPLRHGVIQDFDITAEMLRYFIRRIGGGALSFSRVVLCVPSGITAVERNAVEEATLAAGARTVSLIEEPMAAAIGAGLPVGDPQGSLIVDIGGGTTEVAVLSLGGIVVWESVRVGGYELDEAIVRYVDATTNLLIGPETAEAAKIGAGSAWQLPEKIETDVAGRDRITGLLRRTTLDSDEVRSAIAQPLDTIVETVRRTLEATPPELAADVASRGIVVAGGGALLRGIDRLLSAETGLPVLIAETPLECVVLGAGASLEESAVTGRPRHRRRFRRGRSRGS
ncbi:MAG: rod shape-determining protein [Actinobacteria bacterium]|nr:MAG: rod shape-determining protein [Actinomycetota bacterium]